MEQAAKYTATWQTELKTTAFKYHVIVAWVAILVNPIWAAADYFTNQDYFYEFLSFRIAVSFATLIGVLFRNKLRRLPEIIAFIPFIGISIQNAYMYSVMNVAQLEKHTFAYIALFIGAGMFVLWKPLYSIIIVVLSFIANVIMFALLSPLHIDEILINGGMLTASVALFTILLINTRTNLTKKEIISRLALVETNRELSVQKEIVEEQNKDIRDSINYAKRIQTALIPTKETLQAAFKEHFVLYKPKDIVAGDFYWFHKRLQTEADTEHYYVAAADCTGHGVPGAMVSVICYNALNRAVDEFDLTDPGEILDKTRELVISTFGKTEEDVKDGMDISLLSIEKQNGSLKLKWAGANNPLWYMKDGEMLEIKANKQPIGKSDNQKPYTTHEIGYSPGILFYLFTDGFADQFGGPEGKKFKYKPMQELIKKMNAEGLKLSAQKAELDATFDAWKKGFEQIDDVCLIGIGI